MRLQRLGTDGGGWFLSPASCKDLTYHSAVHVGEAAVDAVVAERESLVVDAEQVQDGCVQVVAVRLLFGGSPGPIVAATLRDAAAHAGSGEPGDGCAAIVIAARCPLRERHSTKLGAAD